MNIKGINQKKEPDNEFFCELAGSLLDCTDVYFGDGLMPRGMRHKRLPCKDAAMKE